MAAERSTAAAEMHAAEAGRLIYGYVLAGGLSSRMGEKKSAIELDGSTFLEIAASTTCAAVGDVSVITAPGEKLAGTRQISDNVTGCGPMGGMEAALRDTQERGGCWAVFVPVDMPLLPGGLLRELVSLWTEGETGRVGVAVGGGQMQPLVSAIHTDLLPAMQVSLARKEYKLQPLLRSASQAIARARALSGDDVLRVTEVGFFGEAVLAGGRTLPWSPTREEWAWRTMWFANANTPEELQQIRAYREKEAPDGLSEGGLKHLKGNP